MAQIVRLGYWSQAPPPPGVHTSTEMHILNRVLRLPGCCVTVGFIARLGGTSAYRLRERLWLGAWPLSSAQRTKPFPPLHARRRGYKRWVNNGARGPPCLAVRCGPRTGAVLPWQARSRQPALPGRFRRCRRILSGLPRCVLPALRWPLSGPNPWPTRPWRIAP